MTTLPLPRRTTNEGSIRFDGVLATVTDSAANLSSGATQWNSSTDAVSVNTTATLAQLALIAAGTNNVPGLDGSPGAPLSMVWTTVTDSAANLAADAATNGGAGTYVIPSCDVTVSNAYPWPTVAQLAAIDAVAGKLTWAAVFDSATNLAADAATNGGAGTYVSAGHDVIPDPSLPATVAEVAAIDAAANLVVASILRLPWQPMRPPAGVTATAPHQPLAPGSEYSAWRTGD